MMSLRRALQFCNRTNINAYRTTTSSSSIPTLLMNRFFSSDEKPAEPAAATAGGDDDASGGGVDLTRRRMSPSEYAVWKEQMEEELEVMRRELVQELAPSDTPAVAKATRHQMWRLHSNDQTRFSVSNLARRAGVSVERARAILVLEGLAQHARERGEFVGSGAEVDAAIRAAGFEVRDIHVEPPRDRSIAQTPHRISEAFLKGEVDEIQVQRVVAGPTVAQRHAAQRAKLFPSRPPADVPREAVESRPLQAASRRTMRGRRLFVIEADLAQLAADPALRHTVPIRVHERDGAVRTASWDDRRTVFQAYERRPRGNELEPIEHIRRLINTPVNFHRAPLKTKQFLEYEASLKPLSAADAIRLENDDAAAAGPGIVEHLLAADDADFVAEEDYDYDNVPQRYDDAVIDNELGKVVRVDKVDKPL